ncbi:MAG: hybrid sensor histidine kinase/response regulator [Bacillota bacterium]
MLQNQEFIQEFVDEARTHVDNVEAGLIKIDDSEADNETINNLFRAVHSIKGTAGFFGLKNIVELSHSMENVLGELRNQSLSISRHIVDALLEANDCLKSMIEDVNNSENTDIRSYSIKLLKILERNEEDNKAANKSKDITSSSSDDKKGEMFNSEANLLNEGIRHGHKLYKIQLSLREDLDGNNITPIQFFKNIQSIGNIIESYTDIQNIDSLDECLNTDIVFTFLFTTVLEKKLLPLAINVPEERILEIDINTDIGEFSKLVRDNSLPARSKEPDNLTDEEAKDIQRKNSQSMVLEDTIRVNVSLLNALLNLASEMVLGRNQLLRVLEEHRKKIPGIDHILQNIDHITTELQEKIMQTRMQPVANVFNKFPRIIRDLSNKMGKEIELKLEGVEVELDKSIIEALGDPLTHLVRNAADHGLETPDKRELLGKPRTGTIELKAYHEGGYVNIDIKDNGAGINVEKLREKAVERGIISRADTETMGEQESLQLIFKPGFSTAEKVTDVSGRGVGMDVVKTNIEKLGGSIEIFTKVGEGTTIRLMLPLTLAIIPSLIVEVEGQKFALPQVNLQEIVRIKPDDKVRRIEFLHNSEVLRLRGKLLPIVHLSDVLGIEGASVHTPNHASNVIRVLVLKIGSKRFGIAVDSIHESEEILVKPLPKFVKDCRCYSGVTIMGDGKTAMILDVEGIIEKAGLKFTETETENTKRGLEVSDEDTREQQSLLLFKCSGTETFAIDLPMVSRVEEIDSNLIEKIGDKEYIKFRGDTLRVIRPENYLPASSVDSNAKKLYVIIPKLVKYPIGIIIEKIYDTVQTSVKLKQDDLKAKGIIGSTIINNRIVLLINIYELFESADPDHYRVDENKRIGEKRTVLVAEDTPLFQRLEKDYLETAGFNVLMAPNGKEALQILQEKEVDLVISDIQMPEMDGLELIKKIREDKKLRSLPVIAVTSMAGDLQKKAGLDAGFDFYEFKLDRDKLLEKLELALKKRRKAV